MTASIIIHRNREAGRADLVAPQTRQQVSSYCAGPAKLAASVALVALLALAPLPARAAGENDVVVPVPSASDSETLLFRMVPSAGAAECLGDARADVAISSFGPVEHMTVVARGLPPETEFDLFVIQLPNPPFGLSWYQGDLETDSHGRATGVFIGRFNIETFIVAPGSGPAPVVHDDDPFPDADTNPETGPVHTFHLGLWFNSPEDAAAAGCPDVVTPFNGEHDAGIQALNTGTFPDEEGPLIRLGD